MYRYLTLTLLAMLLPWIAANEVLEKGEIVFVHLVFRHGDRTPIDPYPNDPYKDPSNWPTGWGQLTNLGKERHYELGKWFRSRYAGLLNETYTREEIYIRSTDVDRTLMSAQSNLAGLYEPKSADVWNPRIAWQPIPVHTLKESNDEVLAMKKSCPAYDREMKNVETSTEYQEFEKRFREVYDYLTLHTGEKVNGMLEADYLYSCLHIEELNNKTLPAWTAKVYPEPLRTISAQCFATSTFTRQAARLQAGPLLKDILDGFEAKVGGKVKQNMKMYSGHDSTVAALLNTMKLFDPHPPPFAACVMLELRLYENQPYVTVVYKNDTNPRNYEIPGCGVTCSLKQMKELYADVLPEDWNAECNDSRFHSILNCVLLGFALCITMTLLIFFTFLLIANRSRSRYRSID